jgi:hypothetical protein
VPNHPNLERLIRDPRSFPERVRLWIVQESRWSRLRLLGNSAIAKATIAIPLLGYFILFNANLLDYLKLHPEFCTGRGCSVSWRLFFIYFGCFAIALGSTLYSWKCPALIKKYDSAAGFFEAEKTYFNEPRNLDYLLHLIELKKEAQLLDSSANEFSYGAEIVRIDVERLADPMGELYRLQNYTHPIYRACALAGYGVGALLLLVPTIGTFIQVFSRFIQDVIR